MKPTIRFGRDLLIVVAFLQLIDASAFGQTPDSGQLAERLVALERSVSELRGDIARLSGLVKAALPPGPVVDIAPIFVRLNGPAQGSRNATVAFIEFSDFQCPFCAQYTGAAYPEIKRNFVETGKIQYLFRHLPLEQLHPNARKAAEASECARDQGRFWEYHDRLFANQKALRGEDLDTHARAVGLDISRFQMCVSDGRMAATISESIAEAKRLGLTGTPSFLIGEIQNDGTVRVTRRISGAQPFSVLKSALDDLIQTMIRR